MPIEASTTKDLEKEIILDKPKKSVLKAKSKKPNRHTTADKEKTVEEPIEMGADANQSPELFPSRNETENGENTATLTSQTNEAFVFCDIHNVSKAPNATHIGSRNCDPLSLRTANFVNTDTNLSRMNVSDFISPNNLMPVETNSTLLRKDEIKDENNSFDSDDSTITEIFQYPRAKRKSNAISLNSSEITLDTTSIKVKQEEENVLNEPMAVVADTELQVLHNLVESMATKVKNEEVTVEESNISIVGITHDSTSDFSVGQCRSNASLNYFKSKGEIAAQVTEKVDMETESDSLLIIKREVTTQARESENNSANLLASESSKSRSNHINNLISSWLKNKTAVENNPVKRSVKEITSKSHSYPASRSSDSRSGTKLDTTENQSEIYTNIASTAASECVRVLKTVGRVVTNPVTQNINEKCRSANNIENVNFEQSKDRKNKEKDIVFKFLQIVSKHGKKSGKERKKPVIEQLGSDKITPTVNLDPSSFEISPNVLRKAPALEFSSSSKCAKKTKKVNETGQLKEIIGTQAKDNFRLLVSKYKKEQLITNETAKRKARDQPATQHKKRKLSNSGPDYFIEDCSQAGLDLSEISIEKNENKPTKRVSSPSLKITNTESCKVVTNFRIWDYLEEVAKFNNYIMKPCFTDLKAHFSHMSTITLGSIPNALVSSINYTSTFALLNCPAKLRFQAKTLLVRDDSYNFEIFESSLRFTVSINASKEKDLLEFLAAIKSRGPQSCCSSPTQAASIRALQTILSRFKYFTLINIQEKVKCHDCRVSSSATVIPNSKSLNTAGTALMYKSFELLNNKKMTEDYLEKG